MEKDYTSRIQYLFGCSNDIAKIATSIIKRIEEPTENELYRVINFDSLDYDELVIIMEYYMNAQVEDLQEAIDFFFNDMMVVLGIW